MSGYTLSRAGDTLSITWDANDNQQVVLTFESLGSARRFAINVLHVVYCPNHDELEHIGELLIGGDSEGPT